MKSNPDFSRNIRGRSGELPRFKNQVRKRIGYVPNRYMPEELIWAADAIPVALARGGDPEPVAASSPYLGRFIDPFCRAQIGYRQLKEEPFYQDLDLLIVPVTDIHVRAIADSWDFYADGLEVFRLGVPHIRSQSGLAYYLESLSLLKDKLQELTGKEIGEAALSRQIAISNRIRSLLREISLSRKDPRPPITGKDFICLHHDSFFREPEGFMEDLASLRVGLKKRRPVGPSGPRIFLTGSTLAVGDYKVVDLIEENGASLVIEEFSEGMRDYWQEIGGEDIPLRSIAKAYFLEKTPPAFFRGVMKERFQALLSFVKDFQVDGVVWYSLMYRECYDIEGYFFRDPLEKIGIPLLKISSEYDASEAGALRTRLETFVEGLRKR